MQGSRPTTDAVGSLRGRLGRLDGLPIRSATVSCLLDGRRGGIERPIDPALLDPGLALSWSGFGAPPPRERLADPPWWPPAEGRSAEARDRLWRFCVATAIAAHRLAAVGGDPDPVAVGRAGLLHPVALWALAAVDPGRLAEWMAAEREEERARLEGRWFGREAAGFGAHLARRWGCGPALIDAALLAGRRASPPEVVAHDPVQLDWIRKARGWASRTPWALPGPCTGPAPTDEERRWLVAAVQSHCVGGLAGGEAPLDPSRWLGQVVREFARADRMEEELADLSERLGAALELLDRGPPGVAEPSGAAVLDAMAEFAAGAAHELNNPLAIIVGRAQLLLARTSDPEQRKALQTIIGQGRRAHQMLRDLMYIARPPEPRRIPCLPDQILRGVVDDLAGEARARAIRLRQEPIGEGRTVATDPEALRHLGEALIRNALEATPAGGEVVVASRLEGGAIVWTVADSGIGLDRERAAHLLDPFYCGRQAGRGLGLGLPRVARFVRSVGGSISWDAGDEGGTVARVELPIGADRGTISPAARAGGLRDAS